jgi:hypothetical protein
VSKIWLDNICKVSVLHNVYPYPKLQISF